MRNRVYIFIALLGCVLIAAPLLAQNPTGTITGRVTHQDGPMPGVTVTADSPSMQGQKVAISGGAGEYIFRFLPSGDYTISFAIDGFHTLEIPVVVSVAQSKTVDAIMYAEAVREEIVVTGAAFLGAIHHGLALAENCQLSGYGVILGVPGT